MLFIVALLLLFSHLSQGTYVVSWGDNSYGQLGNGNMNTTFIPTVVLDYNTVTISNIRVGLSTHFAMAEDGTVYCSGNNVYGQLGINSNIQNQITPVRNSLAFGLDVYPIGPQTIAYNSTTKDVYGWGIDAAYMQGSAFSGYQLTPRKSTNSEFLGLVVGVSTAWSASFVILNGGAYAAGKVVTYSQFVPDSALKLGTGATQNQPNFVRMSFWNNNPLMKLFPTDSSHVCGLSKSYSLYCWGKNNMGQLGVGHTNDLGIPALVSFFDDQQLYIGQLKTGDAHTIVLTCGGKVYSWGSNTRGNLGLGTKDTSAHPNPTLIGNLTSLNIVEITSAWNSVFARTSSNDWLVWGAATSNITLMPQTSDTLSPVVNPYFKQNGLTRLAVNSKSNYAFAWADANPPTSISPDCPALVDECGFGMDNCALNTLCVDTERSYWCLCPAGFSGDGIDEDAGGTGCHDINECTTNQCLPQATCVNQLGSFYCSCPKGYDGDGKINGTGCNDVDECAQGGYCTANTVCTNTVGSYTCACQTGYRQVASTTCGIICSDIDECNTQHPCGPGTYCNNTAGSYNCPCLPGYTGSPCNDVNECTSGAHNCETQSYCANQPGTFSCQCPTGFTGDGISTLQGGVGCLDVNECNSQGTCDPNASCANSVGSYSCTCNAGFTGDGHTCTDVDECSGTNNCVTSSSYGVCNNTVGSYTCGCQSGFSGNGIKTSVSGGTGCTDIDECTGTNKCDSAATCTNTPGSYTCSCPSGYSGSGFLCYVVNCTTGTYANSATTCASCPAGTYNDQNGAEKCTPCPAGTYNTATGQSTASACLTCSKNTYSTAGSTQCLPCPPGTTGGATAGTCTPCPAGQYGLQGTCKNCGVGWFSSSPGATDCTPCAPGYFTSSNTATNCTICPAGSTSKGRAASCDKCPAGNYASKPGQYYCAACPPGSSTQGATGASSCTPCPVGTATPSAGTSTCPACAAGTYSAVNGSTVCTLCSPGTFQNQTGQTSCNSCTNWQYSDFSGATSCASCYAGYAGQYEFASTLCLACPPGTYRTAGTIPICTPCFPGSATELAGQAHCSYCMGGYYAKKCGQTSCDACAPGTYSSYAATGADNCPYCPYGQESFGTAYFCYY